MTDKQKIKHTIAVLKEIDNRLGIMNRVVSHHDLTPLQLNILDLRKLLEEPHKKSEKKIEISAVAMLAAVRLFGQISGRKPNIKKPDLDKWAIDMDLILRIDKRTPEKLQEVIDWCQQDSFWQNNILSPAKLRKQLDRLELQMANDWQWQKRKLHRQTQRTGPSAKEMYMKNLDGSSEISGTQSDNCGVGDRRKADE